MLFRSVSQSRYDGGVRLRGMRVMMAIANSITGGLKSIASEMLGIGGSGGSGGSLFNVGLAELTSAPSFSSFEDFINWANANGAGVDTKILAQATELAQGGNLSGAANLLGTASNAYSVATLPSKLENIVSFAQNPTGFMQSIGSGGSFSGVVTQGFGQWATEIGRASCRERV